MSLADRLRTALDKGQRAAPELLEGDLSGLELDQAPARTEAAVLIAITDRAEPGLILTQRTENLRSHAGQVAFPGGRIDPEDRNPIEAALREAHEEIGLDARHVTVIGVVDRYRTGTGYDVTPVLAVIPPDLTLTPSEAEVAEVFEAPLGFVLDRANQRETSQFYRGRDRRFYQIDWQGRRIWGATAAMLVNLSRRLPW